MKTPETRGTDLKYPSRTSVLAWYGAFAVLVFVVPAIATDAVELHHDVYLLVYGTFVAAFLAAFTAWSHPAWRVALTRNIWWSIGVGVVVGVAAVRNVLDDDWTRHPHGAFFAFELFWRGLVYGIIDALALFVFPAIVAFLLVHGDRRGVARKFGFAALTLALTLVVTATYHLGYPQFRGSDLSNPEVGAIIFSIPAMLTGNPAGALVTHGAVHVAAAAHEYYGRHPGFLPPTLIGYRDRWGGTTGWIISAVWVVIVAAVAWGLWRWSKDRLAARRTRAVDRRRR